MIEAPVFKVEPLQQTRKLRLPQFSKLLKILIITLGSLALIGIVVLLLKRDPFQENKVQLTITAPSEISAGQHVTYVVEYRNTTNMLLTDVQLSFVYPSGAVVLHEDRIVDLNRETIDLGTIEGGATGERQFSALIVGSQGNIKTARAVLSYIPEGLTSTFEQKTEASSTIISLAIALNVVAPPTVLNGQRLSYIIDYRNQSEETYRNIRIQATYPVGFTSTAGIQGEQSWDIAVLAPNEGGRIAIEGTLEGRERESKTLSVILQRHLTTPDGPVYVDFEQAESSSVITTPPLQVQTTIKGSTEYVSHVDDRLEYSIRVTNTTDADLSSLAVTVKLEGSMYDLGSIESDGSFDGRTRMILWNSAVIPELGLLRAHQSVAIPFRVKTKTTFPTTSSGVNNAFVKAIVTVETFNVPEVFHLPSLTARDELTTRITTAVTFDARLLLQDSQFGATTPYPPRVNQTSNFTIRYVVRNPSSELRPAKVTALLPPGVTWTEKVRVVGTQVQPVYTSRTSTLTWDLGIVPAGVGATFPAYELYFQVAITPSENQVGRAVELLDSIFFEGTDVFTKEIIKISVPSLNSSSTGEIGNDGSVQP